MTPFRQIVGIKMENLGAVLTAAGLRRGFMRGLSFFVWVPAVFGLSMMAAAGPVTPVDPAQALAEKFAHEGEAKSAAPATPLVTPPVTHRAVKSTPATVPTTTPAPLAKTADIQPAPVPLTVRPSIDYEMDMLRRARAEAAQLKTTDPVKPEPSPLPKPVAENSPASPPAPIPSATPQGPAAAAPSAPQSVEARADPSSKAATTATTALVPSNTPHATVLVVLDPPRAAKPATPPDPILCFGESCYMSLGFETGAMAITKADALKLKNTEEAKAGMCMSKTACVYRDVPVVQGAQAEIVDLANRSATTSGISDIAIDQTCTIEDGELVCDKPISSLDQRIWVVPEAVAMKAGANVLDQAIADGLPEEDQAAATDK